MELKKELGSSKNKCSRKKQQEPKNQQPKKVPVKWSKTDRKMEKNNQPWIIFFFLFSVSRIISKRVEISKWKWRNQISEFLRVFPCLRMRGGIPFYRMLACAMCEEERGLGIFCNSLKNREITSFATEMDSCIQILPHIF